MLTCDRDMTVTVSPHANIEANRASQTEPRCSQERRETALKFLRILRILFVFALAPLPAIVSAEPTDRDGAIQSVTGTGIRRHMEILAADAMEGREAGTPGYDRAAEYVAAQYRTMGLEPLGDDGTYLQNIEFFETRLTDDIPTLSVRNDNSHVEMVFRDDFLRYGGYGASDERISASLVFVGHGISAPEYDHDDFAGVDVQGKILVVLSGAPPHFDTDQRAFYSSSEGKRAAAVERGGRGIITVRTPVDEGRRPWERLLAQVGARSMRWLDAAGKPYNGFPQLAGNAVLSQAGAQKLFELAQVDLELLFERHAAGETGSFDMGLTATLTRTSSQRTVSSANVIGLLPGRDPRLRDEYVIYTAHLDHLGIRPGDGGDVIHSGAYDNAAGIAALLEIARATAAMADRPRRSIVFAALTAEEKGLRGSSYLARNPPVPVDQLVANVNIDMPYLGFPVADIEAFGAEHSTLHAAVQEATAALGLALTPDSMPERVRFIRSDQFSFVQEGIPALAFKAGSKSSDPSIDGKARLNDFLANHYHQPHDDLNQPYSPEGAERFVRSALVLALIIANQDMPPRWNAGDFFGEKFSRPPQQRSLR